MKVFKAEIFDIFVGLCGGGYFLFEFGFGGGGKKGGGLCSLGGSSAL